MLNTFAYAYRPLLNWVIGFFIIKFCEFLYILDVIIAR